MATWVGAASVTGAGTSRVIPVTNATAQGDTLLVILTFSAAGLSASALVDSKGNAYTQDGSFTTTLPYLQGWRSPGATGGPGGGKTAALAPGDTLTATTPATTGQMLASVVSHPGGALDVVTPIAIAAAATTGTVSATPTGNGDLVAVGQITQSTATGLAVGAPFTMLDSRQPGSGSAWLSWSTEQLGAGAGAGVAQAQTMTWVTSGNWRRHRLGIAASHCPHHWHRGCQGKKDQPGWHGQLHSPSHRHRCHRPARAPQHHPGWGWQLHPTPAPITGTGAFAAKKIKLAGSGTYGGIAPITGTGAISVPGWPSIILAGSGSYTDPLPPPVPVLLSVPPPDLIPVTWDGLGLNDGDRGDGLVTVVTNVDGWYGSPALDGNDLTRALTDGSVFGFKIINARVVTIAGAATGDRDLLNAFARALGARAAAAEPADLIIGEDEGADDGNVDLLTASVRADSGQLVLAWLSRSAVHLPG